MYKWRCFHCNDVFATHAAAVEHFGASQMQRSACQIDITEYRRMEENHWRHCEEDTDGDRALHSLRAEMSVAVIRSEEQGYARGLADARKHPKEVGLVPEALVTSLFDAIAHGDEKHRAWLKQAIADHFAHCTEAAK